MMPLAFFQWTDLDLWLQSLAPVSGKLVQL